LIREMGLCLHRQACQVTIKKIYSE
jgi:hypothetical protein